MPRKSFGGGLEFNSPSAPSTRLSIDKSTNPIQQELMMKKMKKRLQLKNLLVNKFRNKYSVADHNKDEVNCFI